VNWKPNKWIATALNVFFTPLGLVYAGAPRLGAMLYGGAMLLAAAIFFLAPGPRYPMIAGALHVTLAVVCMSVAWQLAARAPLRAVRPAYTRWYGLLAIALAYAVVIVGLRAFVYETFRTQSTSMAPSVDLGTNLVVQKWGYGNYRTFGMKLGSRPISATLTRGDVIVFDFPPDPSQQYIKRLVGLPGDKVAYRDRQLFVNGVGTQVRALAPYLDSEQAVLRPRFEEQLGDVRFNTLLGERQHAFPEPAFALKEHCVYEVMAMQCEVPPGHYFVMGDNRDNSADSRYWGFVPASHIVGKAVRIIQ
jgi:signal peptidase I